MWTFSDLRPGTGPIRRVGINFGAPGDRFAEGGTLWLDHPSVGGQSPEVKVEVKPENVQWFRKHSSRIAGEGLKWVAASGGKGVEFVAITLIPTAEAGEERAYTVRLHFSEPDDLKPGARVFDVKIQGQPALKDFDIVKEAGGPDRPVVKEFRGIKTKAVLTVSFAPSAAAKDSVPLICGIEAVAEK